MVLFLWKFIGALEDTNYGSHERILRLRPTTPKNTGHHERIWYVRPMKAIAMGQVQGSKLMNRHEEGPTEGGRSPDAT